MVKEYRRSCVTLALMRFALSHTRAEAGVYAVVLMSLVERIS
jgi:hypothetical protein